MILAYLLNSCRPIRHTHLLPFWAHDRFATATAAERIVKV
jgi:hypothetical protein